MMDNFQVGGPGFRPCFCARGTAATHVSKLILTDACRTTQRASSSSSPRWHSSLSRSSAASGRPTSAAPSLSWACLLHF